MLEEAFVSGVTDGGRGRAAPRRNECKNWVSTYRSLHFDV